MADDKKKKIDLETLAQQLHPDTIIEKVDMIHDKSRESYKLEKLRTTDYDEFRGELIKFIKHQHKNIYGNEMDDARAFHVAYKILQDDHRGGGFVGNFKLARDGKMREVLDKILEAQKDEHREAYSTNVFGQIDPTDLDAHTKIAENFIDKYKSLMGKGETYTAQQLAKDWQLWGKKHAQYTKLFNDDLRKYKKAK